MTRRARFRAWGCIGSVVAVLFTLAVAPLAAAVENETFGITPFPESVGGTERGTFVVPLESGAVFEDALRVYNRTDQPLELIVYAADAEAGVDGTISVGFRGSRPKGVGTWIDLERDSLNLPPHGEAIVRFRINVGSADPVPDLGAISVEHTAGGLAANLSERLHLVVRTSSPNSPTTSVRVRPLLLRSPWIILAIVGLVVALVIVWLGARRARRPKDALVPPGGLREREAEVTPAASKPVLRRLGQTSSASPTGRRRQNAEVGAGGRSTRPGRARALREAKVQGAKNDGVDSRPLLDDLLIEIDEEEADLPARRNARPERTVKRRPKRAAKTAAPKTEPSGDQPGRKRRYIPLDDL